MAEDPGRGSGTDQGTDPGDIDGLPTPGSVLAPERPGKNHGQKVRKNGYIWRWNDDTNEWHAIRESRKGDRNEKGDNDIPHAKDALDDDDDTVGNGGNGGGGKGKGKAKGGGGGAGPADSDADGDLNRKEIEDYLRQNYPSMIWALEHPELGDLLVKAVRKGWNENEIQARIMATDWWQSTKPTKREWYILNQEDPASAEQLRDQARGIINRRAQAFGVSLSKKQLDRLVERSLKFGWLDMSSLGETPGSFLNQAITSYVDGRQDLNDAGELQRLMSDFTTIARNYFVPLHPNRALKWAMRVMNGTLSEDAVADLIQRQAVSRMPALRSTIESGVSPQEFFDPYRDRIASLLEVTPDSIDIMNDPRFNKILEFEPQEGKGVRPMTLSEAERMVRKLPEWRKTRNAQVQFAEMTEMLLQEFGVADLG